MDWSDFEQHLYALTEHQRKILDIIYSAEQGWMSRLELAKAMGKRRLNPYDMSCLDLLAEQGLIEVSQRPSRAPHVEFAHIYRVPDGIAQSLQGAH